MTMLMDHAYGSLNMRLSFDNRPTSFQGDI